MTLRPVDPARTGGDGSVPFAIAHELQHHPLLRLDALAECALELQDVARRRGTLTADKPVEHHRSDLPPVLPGGRPPRLGGCRSTR